MMKYLIFLFLFLSPVKFYSQNTVIDFVMDEKATAAFTKEHIKQLSRLIDWSNNEKIIKTNTEQIAIKVTFIEFVRDSLFKSLQDVSGIVSGEDLKEINKICYDIEVCQLQLDNVLKKDAYFTETVESCRKQIVDRAQELLKVTNMAVTGQDENNLIDKKERVNLLNYMIKELRKMRLVSQNTLTNIKTIQMARN